MVTHIPIEIIQDFALADLHAHVEHLEKASSTATGQEKDEADRGLAILRAELSRRFGHEVSIAQENQVAAGREPGAVRLSHGQFWVVSDGTAITIKQKDI